MMTKTLWQLYAGAYSGKKVGVPWKIYDTTNHNKVICKNYGDLCDDSLDEKEVVSYGLVYKNYELKYVKVYVK